MATSGSGAGLVGMVDITQPGAATCKTCKETDGSVRPGSRDPWGLSLHIEHDRNDMLSQAA